MEALHNFIKQTTAENIGNTLQALYPDMEIKTAEIYQLFGKTPNLQAGHMAFATFPLAKTLRQAPPQIAQKIKQNLTSIPFIKDVVAQGPYLNFFYDLPKALEYLFTQVTTGKFFSIPLEQTPLSKMFEYSQPNTHKELHVGHMRNLCLGNALVRLNNYIGHKTVPVTYPGDLGTHVAKCLWYLKNHNTLEAPTGNKGTWLGVIYTKATQKLDELGPSEKETTDQQLAAILKEIDTKQGEYYDLWLQTRQWSVDLFKQVYAWADVKFDKWYYESEVDGTSIQRINQLYAEGKLIKDKGAIGMDLSEEKLGFCMLIKSDGNGLYATKDIELAYEKFEEFNIDQSLYIVDKRQAHHFKQVFATLKKIGFEKADQCFHLSYDFVELPSGAMSSRKGNIIPLTELIEKMEGMIKEKYLTRHDDMTAKQKSELATIIANGAIKYGMIRIDNNRKIVFDMDEWLKLDGETGPYLQYVHARIATMLEKFPLDNQLVNFDKITTPQEEALTIHLLQFNDAVYQAADQYKPSVLTSYLFDLGKLFNSFYAECPIGKADDEELKHARLAISLMVKNIMAQGLELLGIKAPKRM